MDVDRAAGQRAAGVGAEDLHEAREDDELDPLPSTSDSRARVELIAARRSVPGSRWYGRP